MPASAPAPDPGCGRCLRRLHQCDDGSGTGALDLLDHRAAADAFEDRRRVSEGHGPGPQGQGRLGEQLEQQVRRSTVSLEARIKLQSLTLDNISRLQPGDVIPFLDSKDVRVEINANGRDLYICEFGRSGAKYTVRVKDTHGSESDILHHLMS